MATEPEEMRLSHADLLQLKRWNTPTVYNGWEQITHHDVSSEAFNLDETLDFMPQMGPMIGYAVTVVIEPSNPGHRSANPSARQDYRRYVAEQPGPKIVVVQDLDKPRVVGAFWGEVSSNIHRALGCVGTITDGGIRDLDEMCNAGFKVLARRLCVGHAYTCPVRWGCDVEVFGQTVQPGQLIHADKHGFLVVPREDESRLLDAVRITDATERDTFTPAVLGIAGQPVDMMLHEFEEAAVKFSRAVANRFGKHG